MNIFDIRTTLEQDILGAFIGEEKLFEKYGDKVKEYYFHNATHRNIFRFIKDMDKDGVVVDLMNFLNYNRTRIKEIHSVSYITDLVNNRVFNLSAFESKIEQLINNYKIEIAKNIIPKVTESSNAGEVTKALEEALEGIYSISSVKEVEPTQDYDDYLQWLYDESGDNGAKSGLYSLDAILGNFQKGRMITIFARSGVGKTTVAVEIAGNMALNRNKVIYASGEMGKHEVFNKIVSSKKNIPYSVLANRQADNLQKETIVDFIGVLANTGLYVTNETNIEKLLEEVKLYKMKYGLDVLFLDYVNKYITGADGNTLSEKIGYVSSKLKNFALDENVCVVLLAQANRKSDDKIGEINEKVTESDIQDSARIEQDSDQVIALYRNKKFDNAEYRVAAQAEINYSSPNADKNPSAINMTIVKNRHGAKGTKAFKWDGEFSRVTNFMQ